VKLLRVDLADPSKRKALNSMIKEMPGIAEGILQDLYDDHDEVSSLLEAIADSEDGWERNQLFQQMRAKLLTHSHAEDEVLYRRLKASQHETSRKFAEEGEREHQLVEQQLQKMLAADDKLSVAWMAQLTELQKLVDHHVDEEESTGFSCARDEFDKDELEAMGTEFQRRKDELMVNAVCRIARPVCGLMGEGQSATPTRPPGSSDPGACA
jgi:hemerythrin-like domain-containing protein